ncbi:p53-induced death domain-containing protein 1-like [Branchiostoma lanceolatum]|uniref:p53-induced death domain-containing protein 1-like n=1 Tax=Branchiostoma lanceolatum TaxID=7740 RepID=UPI003455E268
METEITCQVTSPNDVTLPLKDGEMLVSDIIELGPHGTTFHQPVTVQMQYISESLGGTREAAVWVTEDRSQWTELETTKQTEGAVTVSVDHFSLFAVVSQPKQDQFPVSTEGCTLTSSTQPAVQLSFPKQSVDKPTEVKIQVQEVPKRAVEDMKTKDQSSRGLLGTSPIVNVESASDSEVQFHKPVTVRVPHPQRYMDVQHEGPTKLRVMSCEEGTEDWVDETDNVNIRAMKEFVEFEVSHFTRWIVIVVTDIYDDPKELGPIPLRLCRWLQHRAVQFMLLQREDNENEVVIECALAKYAEKTFRSRKHEGYTGPLPSGSVNLFEGQKVEIILQGNVSLDPGSRMKQHMTFHSKRVNRVHMQVIAMESNDEKSSNGKGSVWFYAVPRVEIVRKKGSRAHKLKKSVGKSQQSSPEGPQSPEFLCQLPIQVKYKMPQQPVERAEGDAGATSEEPSTSTVGVYFHFIKEIVATDWKDLAGFLGFEGPDISNIEGRNRDDKSRCNDMLWEWRKKNGNSATIQVLMEALSEAKLQNVVDALRGKYPEIN